MDDISIFDRALTATEVSRLASTNNAVSIAENSANGTNVVTVATNDVDAGDGINYSIHSGNTNSTFAIGSTSGQVTVNDSTKLNYEANSSYTLVIRATDTAGLTTDQTVTVTVTDVNEAANDVTLGSAPTGLTTSGTTSLISGTTYQLTPNSTSQGGAVWGAVNLAQDFTITSKLNFGSSDAGGDGMTFALQNQSSTALGATPGGQGAGGITGAFGINFDNFYNSGSAGEINSDFSQFYKQGNISGQGTAFDTANAHDNLEDGLWHDVVVSWNASTKTLSYSVDGVTVDSKTYDVVATDWGSNANGYFGFTAKTGAASNQQQVEIISVQVGGVTSIAENSANGSIVGLASAIDPDRSGTVTYSLTDDAGGRFAINSSTGQITVANGSLLDFETTSSHNVIVRATDQGNQTFDKTLTITLTNVNEVPTALALTGVTTGAGSSAVYYATTDSYYAYVSTSLGWEAAMDNAQASFLGGVSGTLAVVNSAAETAYLYTLNTITNLIGFSDKLIDGVWVAFQGDTPVFQVWSGSSTGSAVAGNYTNFASGQPNNSGGSESYAVFQGASSQTWNDVAGTLTRGSFVEWTGTAYRAAAGVAGSVMEDAAAGTVVGNLSTTDADAVETFTYTLIGGATSKFQISGTQLQVKAGATFDFETTPVETVTIRVTDSANNTRDLITAINVVNVNEAPTNTGVVGSTNLISNGSFESNTTGWTLSGSTIRSNTQGATAGSYGLGLTSGNGAVDGVASTTIATTVGQTYTVTFDMGAYAITGGINSAQTMNFQVQGASTLINENIMDAGAGTNTFNSYRYTFVADSTTTTLRFADVSSNTTSVDMMIDNVQAYSVTTSSPTLSIAENSANNTVVGQVTTTEPDAYGVLSYSLFDNAGGAYAVNSATGVVTVANSTLLDFETTPVSTIVVRVTDQGGLTFDKTITINLTNVNEAPVAVADSPTRHGSRWCGNGTAGTNPTGNVLTNDTDVDAGDTKTIVGVATGTIGSASGSVGTGVVGTYGTISIAADGTYTYTVDNNNATVQALRTSGNTLQDVFTYTMRDTTGLSSTTQMTVTIQGANDAPVGLNLSSGSDGIAVANPSFESDVLADSAFTNAPSGWTATANAGAFNPTTSIYASGNGSDGANAGYLNTVGTLSQILSTNFDASRCYVLSVDVGRRLDSASTAYGIELYAGTTLIASASGNTGAAGTWTTVNLSVVGSEYSAANGGALKIVLQKTSAAVVQVNFDNVSLKTLAVAENATNGTLVTTVSSVELDAADTVSYSLLDSAGGRFAINSTSGQITVADGSLLNFETSASHVITVQATDAAGATTSRIISIQVVNVNESPTAIVDAVTAVEAGGINNGTAGTNPTDNVLTNDIDPDASDTKTIIGVATGTVGSASGSVGTGVVGTYGTINIAADGSFTYTVNNSNSAVQGLRTSSNTLSDIFTYTVRDAAGLTSTNQVTVTIQGANDTPTVANALIDKTAIEDKSFSYQFASNSFSDVDASDTLTYSATLASGSALPTWLSFDSLTRTFSGTPTNADAGTITVRVTATDAAGAAVTDDFTITTSNTADAPTIVTVPASGAMNTAIPLSITPTSTSVAGAESLYVTISGVPTGATLSAGLNLGGGVWQLSSAQLSGLTITPPLNNNSDFTLSIVGRANNGLPTGSLLSMEFDGSTPYADGSGNNRSMTQSGGVTIASGTADFDGVNDSANDGGTSTMSLSGDYSVSLWVRPDSTGQQTLVALYNGSSHGALIELTSTNTLRFLSRPSVGASGGDDLYATIGTFNDGNWHHVTAVRSGTTMTLYWDGVQVGSQAASTGMSAGLYANLGSILPGSTTRAFDGGMDRVAIYNRALTANEIALESAGRVGTSSAVTLAVTVGNSAPSAVNDTGTAVEAGGTNNGTAGSDATGNVLTNDTDPDVGDTKAIIGVAAGTPSSASSNVGGAVSGSYGSINIAVDGSYTYTVNENNSAVQALRNTSNTLTDVFTYTMTDSVGALSTARVTLTIQGANDAPTDVVATRYLSTMTPTASANTYSGILNDVDHTTNPLILDGVTFARGLGQHAPSSGVSTVDYAVNGATTFRATIGVNDYTTGTYGSVIFRVYVDGNLQYTSGILSSVSPPIDIAVNTTGGSTLQLEADNSGNEM
ncbi:MAG: cadherin domain-containing protein [Planctomycetaceae bacterium]